MQDKIVDHHDVDTAEVPEYLLVSDIIYYKWLKEYQRSFHSGHFFWALFEKYLGEFVSASLWEKREHCGKMCNYAAPDLVKYGHKFSLLKISAAGVCLAGNEVEKIETISNLIDNYHIGYQLHDDVLDWKEDLPKENYTYFISKIQDQFGVHHDQMQIEDFLKSSDLVKQHLSESNEYYVKAARIAEELKCIGLMQFIQGKIRENENFLRADGKEPSISSVSEQKSPARINPDSDLVVSRVHIFQNGCDSFLYQIDRKLAIKIDEATSNVVRFIECQGASRSSDLMRKELGLSEDDATEMLNELIKVGVLKEVQQSGERSVNDVPTRGNDQTKSEVLVSLGILMSNQKHGKTDIISFDVAKRAIDLLFMKSGYISDLFVHLFLGDAIDEAMTSLLGSIFDYAKKISAKLFKNLNTSINIDLERFCAGFTPDEKDVWKRLDSIRSLFEIENSGRFIINILASQRESQLLSKELAQGIGEGKSTNFQICTQPFCSGNHLDEAMPPVASTGDHSDMVRAIQLRLKDRKTYNYFCNAGKSYIVIAPDGKYYPCHFFAKAGVGSMGNNVGELLKSQSEYIEKDVSSNPWCADCWLINLCGGGCIFMERVLGNDVRQFEETFCNRYRALVEEAVADRFKNVDVADQNVVRPLDIRPCDNF